MLALNHHSKKSFANPISGESAKADHVFPWLADHSNNSGSIENTGFINRVTPFLLFSAFLMGFFPYLMITHEGPVQSELLLAVLFPFTVGSIFYTDSFIWNYFQGKKLALIWFLEIATALFFVIITKFI
ncbi:MAG TPA: hypothetical protein PLA68_08165 [Panacibacter sp.]|nr:hypothetical protein [Panacibacter sp.]